MTRPNSVAKALSASDGAVLHGGRDVDSSLGPNFRARLGRAGNGGTQNSRACAPDPTLSSAARYRRAARALPRRSRSFAFFARSAVCARPPSADVRGAAAGSAHELAANGGELRRVLP